MFRLRTRIGKVLGAGLLAIASLSVTNCASALSGKADPADRVAVGSQDVLFVAQPVLSDTALAALSALGWGEGRFQAELRKELAYQLGQRRVTITEDSAAAEAWLAVRLDAYEIGSLETRYLGDAGLRTADGERRIAIRKVRVTNKRGKRSDPTVDHILEIAQAVASQARKAPAASTTAEYAPQMWMIF